MKPEKEIQVLMGFLTLLTLSLQRGSPLTSKIVCRALDSKIYKCHEGAYGS